jgi:hypothetical protein
MKSVFSVTENTVGEAPNARCFLQIEAQTTHWNLRAITQDCHAVVFCEWLDALESKRPAYFS